MVVIGLRFNWKTLVVVCRLVASISGLESGWEIVELVSGIPNASECPSILRREGAAAGRELEESFACTRPKSG